jgi:polyisoprenoid-binding protein YceI
MKITRLLFCLILWLQSHTAYAAPTPIAFKIVPDESSITFDVMQNNEHVTGNFATFSGDINFHPEALGESNATVTIAMDSVQSNTTGVASNLKKGEYFEVSTFPQARFETQSFKDLGNKHYEVQASLTIKSYTQPIVLVFLLDDFNESSASITGGAVLKRSNFHVGSEDTASIKDDVKVVVKVKAVAEKK